MDKLSSFKDTIIDHRSNVFDKDGTVKPWKQMDLLFYCEAMESKRTCHSTILKDIL